MQLLPHLEQLWQENLARVTAVKKAEGLDYQPK